MREQKANEGHNGRDLFGVTKDPFVSGPIIRQPSEMPGRKWCGTNDLEAKENDLLNATLMESLESQCAGGEDHIHPE